MSKANNDFFGAKYDTSKPIIISLIEAAKEYGNDLPDHVFSEIVQEYSEDEDSVMEKMAVCKSPVFNRHSRGWSLTNIKNNE